MTPRAPLRETKKLAAEPVSAPEPTISTSAGPLAERENKQEIPEDKMKQLARRKMKQLARRIELVRLMEHAMLPPEVRKEMPMAYGRRSPLLKEEAMRETAAVLAASHPGFNYQGLGFDLPGSDDCPDSDWPNVILVGIGGRATGKDAIAIFFGFSKASNLADRMCNETPSAKLVEDIRVLTGGVVSTGDSYEPIPSLASPST
jgi:hypothetical protein